ncbi:MAG TPA: feruloyl-CoA synthase [Bradyrhizobium sp.]|nr:feruloyl-CoA synthase [Bradyrhizobium sp.]
MSGTSTASRGSKGPLRNIRVWKPEILTDHRSDGTIHVGQSAELGAYPNNITERLAHWATASPDRVFLAERGGPQGEWRGISYAEAFNSVRRLGHGLLQYGLSADRPLLILSGNDIEHALLGLAACHVGIPYSPIAPAYSTISADFEKLRDIVALLTPGLVFAADGARFSAAIKAAIPASVPLIVTRNPLAGRDSTVFAEMTTAQPSTAVDAAHSKVGPDTIAKFLFTSGSTGSPKAVINTQRMICSNQEMVRDCYAFVQDEPPVILDWAPWNHTAGGNKVFGLALYNGGTFYIDDGRPTPSGIEATVRNLRDVAPTWYFNVPKGFIDLIPWLETDPDLRKRFFGKLNMILYAGAGLPQRAWDAIEALSVQTTGERVLLATGLGATETGPFSLMCMTPQEVAGNCGIPALGVELKLVPFEGRLEARLRGPNVTPGYWRNPELTANAFDEEGFYRLGDALRFADPSDAGKGFYFDGRIGENFKLTTGTWVNVGPLRAKFIDHFGAIVQDVVIAGLDREFISVLVVPDLQICRTLCPEKDPNCTASELIHEPRIQEKFRSLLSSLAAESTGSSNLIRRLLVLEEPMSLDRGEITDKGSVSQRAVLRQRAHLIDELYSDNSSRVIAI